MSSEPRARKAIAEDLDEILAIESAWPTTPHWNRKQFYAELSSDRAYLCVLESQARIAAYGAMKLIAPEAQVLNLAVRPDLAGKGLGSRLMKHLHLEAFRTGCRRIVLEVGEKNIPALRLYSSLGYQIVGRRPKYYNDGSTALLMEATL